MSEKPTYEDLEKRVSELENERIEHKRIEDALKDNKKKFQDLADSIDDVCFGLDNDLNYTYWNNACSRMFDLSSEMIVGKSYLNFEFNKGYEWIADIYKEVMNSGQSRNFESSFDLDNKKFWYEIKAYPSSFGCTVIVKDITERKKAEEKLIESEEKYRALVETSSDIIWEVNIEGVFTYISPNVKEIWGYEQDEVTGKTPFDFVVSEELEQMLKIFQDEVNLAKPFHAYENTYLHKDGHKVVIQTSGTPVLDDEENLQCYRGVNRDITERKQAEEALRESEKKYRNMVENAVEGLFQSTPEGRFLSVNPAFAKMLGYGSPKELVLEISDIETQYYVDPADRRQYLKILQESGQMENFEHRARCKNGSHIWLSSGTRAYFDKNGTVIRYEGVVTDITERKQATKEKANLESQLRQAAKIEAVGTLAGGIAHDFNNILGIIVGNAELAMDDVPDWNPARLNLDEIKTASMRAKNVVRQLLSFSRKSEQEKSPIKIHTIIKESIQLLRASIASSVELRSNIPSDLGTILADPTQIHQVIINLCTNAAHAMEEDGGTLELNLAAIELDDDATAKYLQISSGRYIQLTVSDTGSGIDPEIKDRIFDPYFTTKKVDKGTGIGLSVVHGIVKDHAGTISVYSEPNKGTTVKVLFPVIDEKPVLEKVTPEELPKGNESVLFIDDEKAMVKMGQQILERLGYQVESGTNPVEALERFRLNPNHFDLVITDMTMPQMAGDKFAKEILKMQPDMPIILCTGYSEKITRESAGEIGIRKYIEKPLNKHEISIAIREVLDGK